MGSVSCLMLSASELAENVRDQKLSVIGPVVSVSNIVTVWSADADRAISNGNAVGNGFN